MEERRPPELAPARKEKRSVPDRSTFVARVKGRAAEAKSLPIPTPQTIVKAISDLDVSTTRAWKSFAKHYRSAEPFKIDADPAFVYIEADGRFFTTAKLLFSFERTNSLQIPVNVSGSAPALIAGKLRSNGTVHLEEFEVTDG